MAEQKTTMVVMTTGKEEKEFELQHAERIIKYQKEKRFTTGWSLKEGSGFTVGENDTILKADETNSPATPPKAEAPSKRGSNTASEKP